MLDGIGCSGFILTWADLKSKNNEKQVLYEQFNLLIYYQLVYN